MKFQVVLRILCYPTGETGRIITKRATEHHHVGPFEDVDAAEKWLEKSGLVQSKVYYRHWTEIVIAPEFATDHILGD